MTSAGPHRTGAEKASILLEVVLDLILSVAVLALAAVISLWMAGAIYYDVGGKIGGGAGLAIAWLCSVTMLFAFWQPMWQPILVLLGLLMAFLIWWFGQKPSHEREWHPTAAVLPRAVCDGDVVTFENVRNFEYRSLDDYTVRYESRTYHLANLQGVDVIFFVWNEGLMGHPVLVFDFGPDGRICMSIEARFRKNQQYSVVRGLYRQYELIFLAADERDIILRRTKHSTGQDGYLYRVNVEAEELKAVFFDYVDAINQLLAKPRWYHVLFTNCTTSFYKLPSTHWRVDWRVIANGRLDRALYQAGRLDRSLPFPKLRQAAHLNEVANAAPAENFGDHIRRELERRRHET